MQDIPMETVAQKAKAFGFSHTAPLDAKTLELRQEVRDMCSVDRCQKYGRSWMCPPACGSLEENAAKAARYSEGIVVQTTMQMEDDFDYDTIVAAEEKHQRLFRLFCDQLREDFPGMMPLGAGGCGLCDECTYPGAPCRQPQKAMPSMEAFGLLVSDVCTKNGLQYYYGPQTMTYTACYLLK